MDLVLLLRLSVRCGLLINNGRRIKRFSRLSFDAFAQANGRQAGLRLSSYSRAQVGYMFEALHATNSAATNTTTRPITNRLLRRPACAIDQPLKIPSTPAT